MSFTFDEAKHEYRLNGVVIPSVTQVLQLLHSFAGVPLDVLKAAQERGTAVHLICQYWDEGDLDEDTIDPKLRGYFDAWLKFLDDKRPRWTLIEHKGHHPLGFAGTCDRFGLIDEQDWTIDIKTSLQSHPVWGIQTAAYNHIYGKPNARRGTVRLRPDGTYKFDTWTDPMDWPTFVSLITLINWRNKHGTK